MRHLRHGFQVQLVVQLRPRPGVDLQFAQGLLGPTY